uniref:Uncharacterized protein n=1 Tax=Rhizophora mucronata TaxID=61149 RepID=A0A2P2QG43_RHIMU
MKFYACSESVCCLFGQQGSSVSTYKPGEHELYKC